MTYIKKSSFSREKERDRDRDREEERETERERETQTPPHDLSSWVSIFLLQIKTVVLLKLNHFRSGSVFSPTKSSHSVTESNEPLTSSSPWSHLLSLISFRSFERRSYEGRVENYCFSLVQRNEETGEIVLFFNWKKKTLNSQYDIFHLICILYTHINTLSLQIISVFSMS